MDEAVKAAKQQVINKIKMDADGVIMNIGAGFTLYFTKTLADRNYILEAIKKPYYNFGAKFDFYFPTIAKKISPDEAVGALYSGSIVALFKNELWVIPTAIKKEGRSISELSREASFEGGTEGFVERSNVNVNLVRQYYHDENLKVDNLKAGAKGKADILMLYDSNQADKNIVQDIQNKIQNIKVPVIQSCSELQQHLIKNQWLIPLFVVSQRPDRAIRAISHGKIVIFLDGTATALIGPTSFHDYIHTVDDNYLMPIPAIFLIILRYLALFFSILLPGIYVGISSYNPEIVRVQLALSISASRNGVPYSSFVEVSFMLLMMEFLIEGSLRLPKNIGQTATTVGGLILGQAATQAHLVSTIMIIIVALVAISNFVIPITSMNLTIRVAKYFFILLASLAGVFGLEIGIFIIMYYLFSKKDYNVYYANPLGYLKKGGLASFFNKERS